MVREEGAMHVKDMKPAVVSLMGAFAASLCCLLPLAVIVLGLGSGAFMATTMRYQWILLPFGIFAVTAGSAWYFWERRRCQGLACTMAGGKLNLIALGIATAVLLVEVGLVAFPDAASRLFSRAMVSAANQVERFDAEGTIVSLDPEQRLLTIAHGDIKGFMSPMTMAFSVTSPELLQGIAPGDRVTFQLERTPEHLAVIALAQLDPAGMAQAILAIEGMT
jgi:Cu/Ag efflux protein CusF